uniref:hypothetical protein n=1 Tax=Alloprevotella sp. TaxID=1872471 RepID=UPI00402A3071
MQTFCASEQRKSGNQADEPETMVAVKMRNENMVQTLETQMCGSQLLLCALAAINHEKLFMNIE